MSKEPPVSWAQLMHVGLGIMHQKPSDFWAMSLPEFRSAVSARSATPFEKMGKAQFAELQNSYPDEDINERSK